MNYPTDEKGIKDLSKAVALFHATLCLKAVDDLKTDFNSKKKIIKKILEITKEDLKGTNN